jgi:hypothetical protein
VAHDGGCARCERAPVASLDPSSTTITSIRPTAPIERGIPATTAPMLPASFRAGMTTASCTAREELR